MTDRLHLRARLAEVIAALDRRLRHPGRHTEAAIAADAAALRREAQARIDALDGGLVVDRPNEPSGPADVRPHPVDRFRHPVAGSHI